MYNEISRYEVLFDEKYKLWVPSVSVLINRMTEKNLNSSTKQKVAQSKSMSVTPTSSPLPPNPMGGEIDRQRNLCRVETRDGGYGGYMINILTENLSDRDNAFLVCGICKGIMREAYFTSSGEQFCSCCEVRDSLYKRTITFTKLRNPSKQTPNVAVRKMVDSLKCSCPLIGRGCGWSGTLKDCEDHLDTCGYVHALCELKCGIMIQRNELKHHEEKKCPLCVVECKHCKREFKLGSMISHLRECPKMELPCKLKCGVVMCREDMTQHFNKDCGLVEESCKLGCGAKIKRIGLKFHEEKKCPMCIVNCEHCKGELKLRNMTTHLGVCPKMEVSCEMECGKKMCREDMAQHLKKECKMVGCLLGCEVKMTRNELKTHVTETCIRRNVPCEHCKKDFRFCNLTHHLDKCPKMEVSCELKCGMIMCREDMEQHLMQECGLVKEVCKLGCKTKLTRNERMIHVTETCEQRLLPCEYCVEIVKCCDMTHHLKMCPKMEVSCELKCGMIMCREDMAQHLMQECGLVIETCKLSCGLKMTRDELKIHVTETCVQRFILCEHCKKDFKFCDMTHHLEMCPKMKVSCELKCGVVMCREDVTQHVEQDCVEKEIECPFAKYKCVGLVKRKNLENHLDEKRIEHLELKIATMKECMLKESVKQKEKKSKQVAITRPTRLEIQSLEEELAFLTKPKERKLDLRITKLPEGRFNGIIHKQFQVAGYNLEFYFSNFFNNLQIGVIPQTGKNYDKLKWPFKAEFVTHLSSQSNPGNIKKFRSQMFEWKKEDFHTECVMSSFFIATFSKDEFLEHFINGEAEFGIFVILL